MKFHFANCDLDVDGHTLRCGGQAVAVEPLVFDLISVLALNAGQLVSKDQLIDQVWQGRIVSDSAISAGIAAARKAVGDDGNAQAIIKTVPRRGFVLAAEVSSEPGVESASDDAAITQTIRYTKTPKGQSIAYAVSGSGPAVLRSFLGTNIEVEWTNPRDRATFDLIHQKNKLVRLDYVGIGLSDPLDGPPDFETLAGELEAAANAAGLDDFILYSESGGVHAALRFAAKFPERVRRLVIIGGYVEGRNNRGKGSDFLQAMIDENWTDGAVSLNRAFAMSYYPDGPMDEVIEDTKLLQAALNQESHMLMRDAINDVSNAHLLDQIKCPVLIIHARSDAIHPLDQARKLAAGIPDAELLVLESANHLPFPGHPSWDAFRTRFRSFLDEG